MLMNHIAARVALSIALLPIALFRVAAAAEPATAPGKPAIFVCGDSTSKNSGRGKSGEPVAGWGTPIAAFFDPEKVTVKNVGHAGKSSLTYYNGDWPKGASPN
jgi:rhamnogalacturonan acetylesterase